MKAYVLKKENVAEFAKAVTYQNASLNLTKKEDTEFYLAITTDKVDIPRDINAFEVEENHKLNIDNTPSKDGCVDILLRFKTKNNLDAKFINEKITPAIHHSIIQVLKKHYKDEDLD